MLPIRFNTKTCIKQCLLTTFNSIFIILSILAILEFKLYEKLNNVLFSFYCIVLGLHLLININSIHICIIYFKKYNEIENIDSLVTIHENLAINKLKLKQLLFVLFFIFDLVLGIIFYASGVIYNIPIIHLLFIIAISSFPFMVSFGMILTALLGLGMAINEYWDYITNNQNENTNRNRRTNNSNTYNINIIVPIPQNIAYQNIISIPTPREKNCSICLDDEAENIEWVKLICNHKYHKICITKWFETNSNCPLCRQEILNLV